MGFWTSFAKQALLRFVTEVVTEYGRTDPKEHRCSECGRVVSPDMLQDGKCILCKIRESDGGGRESRQDSGRTSRDAADDLTKAYETLECKASDSDSEIKKRFRILIKECHVDSLPKGLPDYLVEAANKRFREVQEAYELVMKTRKAA